MGVDRFKEGEVGMSFHGKGTKRGGTLRDEIRKQTAEKNRMIEESFTKPMTRKVKAVKKAGGEGRKKR